MELRWTTAVTEDVVVAAEGLFDGPVQPEALRSFLADDRHHLCLAVVDGVAVGFVTGVEMTHPDKGTEMFLYELGVDDEHRRRGIGAALVQALSALARERGCYGMWVLTDEDNEAALRTYAAAGADERSSQVMLAWNLPREQQSREASEPSPVVGDRPAITRSREVNGLATGARQPPRLAAQ